MRRECYAINWNSRFTYHANLITKGISNGLYLDTDYYSDEDSTDVKFKTKIPNRIQSPTYIPIPYFIPSQLYNNLFFNPSIPVLPPSNNPTIGTSNHDERIVQRDSNNSLISLSTRSRLSRQTVEKSLKATTNEAPVKLPTETTVTMNTPKENSTTNLPPTSITISSNSTLLPSVTESFEIGSNESQHVNETSDSHTLPSAASTETSSYYRKYPQPFDPDGVSITTWYPGTTERNEPFRPSEYDRYTDVFKPLPWHPLWSSENNSPVPYSYPL